MNKKPSKYSVWLARIFSVFISIVLCNTACGQGEANNWYFGEYAGITFNTKPVSPLLKGQITMEISNSVISDKQGRLLFYSDGHTIWDSTHTPTPNGKALNTYGAHFPGVIIPKPGSSKQYYLFVSEAGNSSFGLQYFLFDMSLNGGKGDIDTTKTIRLSDAQGGRITAAAHANGKDFWVLSAEIDTQIGKWAHYPMRINAWLVTSAGVSSQPVKSKLGSQFNYGGWLKVSPDGTKIVATSHTPSIDSVFMGDFDSKTGKISNIWGKPIYGAYGIEYSAGSKYLYIGAGLGSGSALYQFNAKALSLADFLDSKTVVDSIPPRSAEQIHALLQLGPDRRIYFTRSREKYLGVIHAPDSAGKACRVVRNGAYLGGKECKQGLPNFVQSFFSPEYSFKGTCLGDTSWFSVEDEQDIDSVYWNFGDTSSKARNTAKGLRVCHLFSDTGNFTVRSITFKDKWRDTNYFNVKQQIYLGRFHELQNIIYKCYDDTITLQVSKANEKWIKWSNGSGSVSTQIADSGYHSVRKYYGSQCYMDDSTKIIFYKNNLINEPFSFGKDKLKCHYDTVGLSIVDEKATKYLWSTGSTQKSIKVPHPDTIWLKVYHGKSCYKVDTIGITNFPISKFTLGPDTFVCGGQSIMLGDFNEPFNEYLWFNKSTSSFYNTDVAGKFWLRIRDKNRCLKTDTINVSFLNPPKVNLGKDTAVCSNPIGFVLDAKNASPVNKYKWGTGKTSQTDTATKTGKYWARVTNKCGTSIDTINLKFLTKPKLTFPDEIIFCDTLAIKLDALNTNNNVNYYWNTKEQTQIIFIKDTGIYKAIVSNNCGKDSASVHVIRCLKYITIDVVKACINQPLDFSIPSNLKLDSLKWNFGDAEFSKTYPKVSHSYKNFGDYKIYLVLFYKGRKDTINTMVSFINPKPDFTVSDVCENDSVRFKNVSIEKSELSFKWKFGDGQNSVLVSPAHFYPISGISQTFNVGLVAKTADGCSDSITRAVTVNANPISDFSYTANYSVVDFKAAKPGNTLYKWLFGNGDSATTSNSNYKYTYPNSSTNYKACLQVTDASGCFSKTCKDIYISAGISSLTKANGFKIYPNPNQGNFTIEIENPVEDGLIEIYNSLGQLVKKVGIVEKVNGIEMDLANGIYLVKVKNPGLIYYQKVSITK